MTLHDKSAHEECDILHCEIKAEMTVVPASGIAGGVKSTVVSIPAAQAEARAERDAAWRKYARHLPTCRVRLAADLRTGALDATPCNCGLRSILENR